MQYTTAKEKEHIREAAGIKSETEAARKGWKFIGKGLYKNCYKKGNIVLKFGRPDVYSFDRDHMKVELRFYKKTPKHLRKYLARVFGGNESIMIQRFVNKNHRFTEKDEHRMSRVAKVIKMWDWCYGQNLAVDKDGNVKAYDFGGQGQY